MEGGWFGSEWSGFGSMKVDPVVGGWDWFDSELGMPNELLYLGVPNELLYWECRMNQGILNAE